jgi:MoCo/4Fe-4S cofactor protein with predicted Tat translocation signal
MDESSSDLLPSESRYWRSLRELHSEEPVDELKAHEFMAGVTDDFNLSELSTMSRKRFLALLSASAAFAAAGCSDYRDKGEIVPYSKKPEEITPGVANYYASTCTGCSQSCGILIKTREGRPIKIDGNPDHPINKGSVCAKGQASILNLYDPNRLREPKRGSSSGNSGDLDWTTADAEVRTALNDARAAAQEVAVITGPILSPTTQSIFNDFASKYPNVRFYSYDFFHDDNRKRAWQKSYGTPAVPAIAWEKAKVIVALESDFLGTEGFTVEQIRKFAAGRDVMQSSEFNRLYSVEGAVSLTGANADYRLRVRPDAQMEFLLSLMNELALVRAAVQIDGPVRDAVSGVSLSAFGKNHGLAPEILEHLVDDLIAHRGESIVFAGNTLDENVHLATNYLNEMLGNMVLYEAAVQSSSGLTTEEEWKTLLRAMKAGKIAAVIHWDVNPVFHMPSSRYREALKSVPVTVSLVEQEDETAQCCNIILPIHHAYESWGDFTVRSGITSLQQPVISPLYATRQKEAIVLTWLVPDGVHTENLYHEYLMKRWEREVYPSLRPAADFRSFWLSALHDGVVVESVERKTFPRLSGDGLAALVIAKRGEGFVLGFRANHFIGDGRFANNGWLQELPHPVSKIVWDNYASVSRSTAKELGVKDNDLLDLSVGGMRQTLPVMVQPGQADRFISVELGYGRTNAGPIGTGVGTDVNQLLSLGALTGGRVLSGVQVSKAGGTYALVSTQEHHALDEGLLADRTRDAHLKRGVVKEGTVEEYRQNPNFLHQEKSELPSITRTVEYNGVKWAMAIDLNKCVGCNACVAGCNVENNIPVVGKDQVDRGREMQWIRIDRYYAGSPDAPLLSHQPMLCQHCDSAPCENVCPVVATTHSPDGLNQMVYNRCVGTKYCSNNCPYKVRRFNFYNFRDNLADGYYLQEPISLVHNPEVTVRSRGVMEKCTFCVQRIMEARQHATEHGHPLKGSDVKTACQEACPAQAIVFGDMNDPESEISRYRKHSLGYYVLEDVNTRPNVTYGAKLRNTHPEKVS